MKNLTQAVINQYGNKKEFLDSVSDICRGGASAGVSGFIYYRETIDFTEKNFDLIMAKLKEDAKDFGLGLIEMLKGFNCFNGLNEDEIAEGLYNKDSDNRASVFNGLAWYALESVAFSFDK